MFETLLITTLLSITAIITGNVVLLALVLLLTRRKKKVAAVATVAPAPQIFQPASATPAQVEQPELVEEPELIEEPDFIEAFEREEEPESVIIANDYEKEAKPIRSSAEFIDDSFVDLFEQVPIVSTASMSWHDKQERKSRMANRLDRLTAPPSEPSRPSDHRTTRPNRPLPMPVAPAGVEPIPELEPTELIIDRPEWADEWP